MRRDPRRDVHVDADSMLDRQHDRAHGDKCHRGKASEHDVTAQAP
jgi:hypothetical protein